MPTAASTSSATPKRPPSPMRQYRSRCDSSRRTVLSAYFILGFISSGTYGRVYKARIRTSNSDTKVTNSRAGPPNTVGGNVGAPAPTSATTTPAVSRNHRPGLAAGEDPNSQSTSNNNSTENEGEFVAIKKFKAEKEGEANATYTGLSQSACREIMLNRELKHVNIAALREVILEDKSIYLVFEYAEHDFLQIIHHHSAGRTSIPIALLKSFMWQLINGVTYLHDNWVIHRDLKPANILVTDQGRVKIGDLGLARIFASPLQPLLASDKLVVTIWYRSPDLLLGARHYNTSIDMWSVGCIFGELIALRPMFKGEENKGDHTKKANHIPLQSDQIKKIFEILGTPNKSRWPTVTQLPEYDQLAKFPTYQNFLYKWYTSRIAAPGGFDLLSSLLQYDPDRRITAREALSHKWWSEDPVLSMNSFTPGVYPLRRITHDDSDPKLSAAAAPPPIAGSGSRTAGSKHAMSSVGSGMHNRAAKRVRPE